MVNSLSRCHGYAVKGDLKPHSTLCNVKCDIPMCSLDRTLWWRSVLHENLYSKWDWFFRNNIFKRKREEGRFVDLRVILVLHCGNEFLKQVLNFCFKLDDNFPRWNYFFQLELLFSEYEVCFKKILWIIPDGELFFFEISFSTSKWNEV